MFITANMASKSFAPHAYQLNPLHWDNFWLIKLWLRKWLRELTSKIDFLSMQWYGLLQKTEFKEWLSTMPAFNVNLHIIQWFLCFNLSMQEKGVPEIQKFSSVQFSYEWFGLGFTGVGLRRRASRFCHPVHTY